MCRLTVTKCYLLEDTVYHKLSALRRNSYEQGQKTAPTEGSEINLRFNRYCSVDIVGKSYVMCILSEFVISNFS
jgi:hypothetical protein